MTTEKPKRKRRTKEEIRLDNLKIKKDKFDELYPAMSKILTVQETSKLLKIGIKEVREQCNQNLLECTPHETIKNQFNIETYQFIDHDNFNKYIDKYLKEKEEKITEPIQEPEKLVEKEKTSSKNKKENIIKETNVVEEKTNIEDSKKDDEKPKRKRRTKKEIEEDNKKIIIVVEENNETSPEAIEDDSSDDKEDNDVDVINGIKTNNKVLNQLFNNRKQKNKKETISSNKVEFKKQEVFEVPYVSPSVHYLVGDKVMLFTEPKIGEDLDEETMDYIEYYKKNLLGKKGVISSISYTVHGHPIYLVYFEKQKDEMYCYHHYLTWLSS